MLTTATLAFWLIACLAAWMQTLTGFALGGIAATEEKDVVAEKKPAGYEPPHSLHGGQIVGGGVRKV